jgi:hypothetical protein
LRLKPKRSYGVAVERKRGLRAGRILCRQIQDILDVIELLAALIEGGGRIAEQKRGSETVRTPQTLLPG